MTRTADRVRAILAERLGADDPADTAHLVNELGVDSLGTIDLVMALEEEFGIEIPDSDMVSLGTVADVVALVDRLSSP